MRIALIATGGRDLLKRWQTAGPQLGTAVDALLQGFRDFPEHEVHLLMPMRRNAQPPWRDGNIIFHDVPTPTWGMMKSFYLGAAFRVRKKLMEIRPEIVHGQGTERECGICAVLSGFPNVITIHGNMNALAKLHKARLGSYLWLAAQLENFTLCRTRGIICISDYVKNLVGKYGVSTWMVPNAIQKMFFDVPREKDSTLKKPLLINVGIISERKRQQELLTVLESLRDEGLDFDVLFVGRSNKSSPYAQKFSELLAAARKKGRGFEHIQSLDDASFCRLFDRASAMIHFSSEESFGLTFAEAIARKLYLFASDVGAARDVAAGVERVQIFRADDWHGMRGAVRNWIVSGKWKDLRSERLPEAFVEKYHPASVARRHIKLYQEVLCK